MHLEFKTIIEDGGYGTCATKSGKYTFVDENHPDLKPAVLAKIMQYRRYQSMAIWPNILLIVLSIYLKAG